MAKIIQFKPCRVELDPEPKVGADDCPHCRHKFNVHVTHPSGGMSCAARGCRCETCPTGDWPKV
jgi:hypothetical protein